MEGWKHSSGHDSPGRSKCFSGYLKARKYILALVMLMVFIMPCRIYAAELNVPETETDSEGELNGTLDNQSNNFESGSDTISDYSETVGFDDTVSGGDASGSLTRDEIIYLLQSVSVDDTNEVKEDYFPLYESYEDFMESPLYVTRYENEVLKKLEFMQYAQAIMIALLFLLIFRKK